MKTMVLCFNWVILVFVFSINIDIVEARLGNSTQDVVEINKNGTRTESWEGGWMETWGGDIGLDDSSSSSNSHSDNNKNNVLNHEGSQNLSSEESISTDDASNNENIVTSILKPPTDDREYVAYTLQNGLRILLCSDAGASTTASAALDIHVGSNSNPREVLGLAHFVEHMLFLGTEKYPDENNLSKLLNANNGRTNAYTSSDDTVYYFDINTDNTTTFAEALNRFASFFINPLFTLNATKREINAIESEYSKNIPSDAWRGNQILKARMNSEHPFSTFSTGNIETLLDDTREKPWEVLNGQLVDFFNRYYSANQMTLAVVAPQSINELKEIIETSFASIPNRDGRNESTSIEKEKVPPFSQNTTKSIIPSAKHVVEIVPIGDYCKVTLTWPIIYASEHDRDDALRIKQSNYIGNILSYKGPGSVLSYLKREGWATTLTAGLYIEELDFETFEADISLTEEGLIHVDKVIRAIFFWIGMVRDTEIPEYIFNEMLLLDELKWKYAKREDPYDYASSIVAVMQQYRNPALYVAGPQRYALSDDNGNLIASSDARTSFSSKEQLDETIEKIQKYLEKLTVDDVLVTMLSKSFKNQIDNKEEYWYGTKYNVRPIANETLQEWNNFQSTGALNISFPEQNQFIPSQAGLAVKLPPQNESSIIESTLPPTKIVDNDLWAVYFKQDDRYNKPIAIAIFELQNPEIYSTAKEATLLSLYELCVSHALNEYAYDAELAGLSFDFGVTSRGIKFTFEGYDEKLSKFAEYILEKIFDENNSGILPKNEEQLAQIKIALTANLISFDTNKPCEQASYYSSLAMTPLPSAYSYEEQKNEVTDISLLELQNYETKLWSSGKGVALLQGNLDNNEAIAFVNIITNALEFEAIEVSEIPPILEALPLPEFRTRFTISEPNPEETNSASQVSIQSIGTTANHHVLLELLNSIASSPFFEELRTNQQLGYIVFSRIYQIGESRTIAFSVQSNVAPVEELTTEIVKFLDDTLNDILQNLSVESFDTYVMGLVSGKLQPDNGLADETNRHWEEIITGRMEFNRAKMEVEALNNLTKADLTTFWEDIYMNNSNNSRVLITEIIPLEGVASSPAPLLSTGYNISSSSNQNSLGINDIQEFRKRAADTPNALISDSV